MLIKSKYISLSTKFQKFVELKPLAKFSGAQIASSKDAMTSDLIAVPSSRCMILDMCFSSFDIYSIHYLKGNVHKKMRFFKKKSENGNK